MRLSWPRRTKSMSTADGKNACSRSSEADSASADYFSTNDDPVFKNDGERINAPVGSEAYFRGLVQEMLASSLPNGVIAAPWEAQTVRIQYAQFVMPLDPGWTKVQAAKALGLQATPGTPPTFKPIILDLTGDGQINLKGTKAVAFDVDASGYYRNTDWTVRQPISELTCSLPSVPTQSRKTA